MDNAVVGHELDWDLLFTRFPDIALALSTAEVDLLSLSQDSSGIWHAVGPKGPLHEIDLDQEITAWKSSLYLEGLDVIYIYGIGLGYYYRALHDWLSQGSDRAIVFFEDDLAVLKTLFSLPIGLLLLKDPRVHIQMIPSKVQWKPLIEEWVRRLISDQVDFTALASYRRGQEKKIKKIRLELLRKSALMSVAVTELLHYDRLMENISASFSLLPGSSHVNAWEGAFQGVPAIICGAGVSLAEASSYLKELENRALIIAGGSAITALHHFGIRPHISIALDPNEEEYARIKGSGCFEIPFVFSSRLHKDVLRSVNVRQGYLCADTGGAFETWMHSQLKIAAGSLGVELGQEALSVTTLAVPLAKHLGCGPILFCGVDLSYKNLQRYPPGVTPSSRVFLEDLEQERRSMEKLVRKKNGEGKFVYTLVKWVMEAACLGAYAKTHPESAFFQSSLSGLPIASTSYLPIEQFAHQFCVKEYDLRGQLHAVMEGALLADVSDKKVHEAFDLLAVSLERCIPLVQELLVEIERKHLKPFSGEGDWQSGRMQVLEMDIMEEPGYEVCLASILVMYRKILQRRYPDSSFIDPEKSYRQKLAKERKIWQECLVAIDRCVSTLRRSMV